MARLPPPPASLKLRDTDAVESRAPKRHRPLNPPPASGSRRRKPNSPPSSRLRAGRPLPPPSKFRRRARSPPYLSTTQRLEERQRAKRPSADAPVDGLEEGEIAPPDEPNRPSHSHCHCYCKHPETSSTAVEKRPDPAIRGDEQELHSEKMDGKNQSGDGWKKGNSFIKPRMKREGRSCYNCKEPGHFANDCPYESRDDHPEYVKKGANLKLLPNPLNKKKNLKGHGKAFIGATYISSDEEGDENKENVVGQANLAMAKPGSIFSYDRKHPETSSAAVEKRPDPLIRGDGQELHSEEMDGKNQSGDGWKKGNSFIKPRMKREGRNCYNCKEPGHFADACPYESRNDHPEYAKKDANLKLLPNPLNKKKNLKGCDGKAFIGATYISSDEEGGEKEENVVGLANLAMAKPGSIFKYDHKAPSKSARHKKMKTQRWAEAKKEMREMKRDKLLENIKKLQACVWLLEKDGAHMAEIRKFRTLLESTKKQSVENETQLAQQVSSASQRMLNMDRLEKMHVETMPAPVKKVERDEQNMDSGKVEDRSLKGCKTVSEQNELTEEVNRLKSELETVRQDRDYQLAQSQSLMADIAKQKEVARRYGVELEDAMRRVAALEEGGLMQRETIRTPQVQLASGNEKLMVPSPTRD